ncbi:MAG: hypothetical protein LBT23_00880 [Synergistaceae bacterium]|jgi:hypothetical protein|nr:hypothetical protein [Synergistaceae bacterium]
MSTRERRGLFLFRHLIGGRTQVVKCELGRMDTDDIGEALRLHYNVTKGLSREIFAPTSDEDMARLLGNDGISLGVWFEDRLICMRALMTNPEWVGETMGHMSLAPDETRRTAYMDHCIVDKEFRGNNVQFLTYYALENHMADSFDTLLTTVSPKNPFSLQNILGCNFVVIGIKELYGGFLRFVMRKKLIMGMPIWTHGHFVTPLSDLRQQRTLFEDDYVGYKMIRKNRGFCMLYAPMAEQPPKGYWKNMSKEKEKLLPRLT